MKKFVLLFLISAILFSKSSSSQNIKNNKFDQFLSTKWRVVNLETFYTSLEFDSSKHWLTINTYVDTIFHYTYDFKKDILILNDGKVKTENRIIKFTKDSLVFSNFLEHKARQVYLRMK